MDKALEENNQVQSCKNCEHEFSGNFCPNCGQSSIDFDRPFGFVFYDFLGNFLSFDARFFKTFKHLLFFPGRLTNDFFAGKRISFTPPFRLFIFASFVLFLLLQFLTGKTLDYSIDNSVFNDSTVTTETSVYAVDSTSQADTLEHREIITGIPGLPDLVVTGDSLDITGALKSASSIRELLVNLAGKLEANEIEDVDYADKEGLKKLIKLLRSPEHFTSKLLQYTSYAFFFYQ